MEATEKRETSRQELVDLTKQIAGVSVYSQTGMGDAFESHCSHLKERCNLYLHGKAPTSNVFPGRPLCQTGSTDLLGSPWILEDIPALTQDRIFVPLGELEVGEREDIMKAYL